MRVVRRAWWYASVPLVLAILVWPLTVWLSPVLLFLAGGILLFFRDPERLPAPAGILSPADGKVSILREEQGRLRVGIYMNVLNVHVNRAPVGGRIGAVEHRTGAHRPAFSKDSDRNERVWMQIEGDVSVEVDLIAGAFARRITPYVSEADAIDRGERLGHIAFGSRADVLLPETYDRSDLAVAKGDRVRAGESVLALTDADRQGTT